jgi:hypothetical protein
MNDVRLVMTEDDIDITTEAGLRMTASDIPPLAQLMVHGDDGVFMHATMNDKGQVKVMRDKVVVFEYQVREVAACQQ